MVADFVFSGTSMPFFAAFILGACLWLLAELSVFGVVVDAIGLPGAILLTLAFSIIGLALLRRLGSEAQGLFRTVLENPGHALRISPLSLRSGALAALGATLLVIPGFLSDCVGLALLLPAWRHHELAPKPQEPNVIDLTPQDWHRIDEPDRR
jgi:UPF0716 protein FxsA